jgi:hypothetical protein
MFTKTKKGNTWKTANSREKTNLKFKNTITEEVLM